MYNCRAMDMISGGSKKSILKPYRYKYFPLLAVFLFLSISFQSSATEPGIRNSAIAARNGDEISITYSLSHDGVHGSGFLVIPAEQLPDSIYVMGPNDSSYELLGILDSYTVHSSTANGRIVEFPYTHHVSFSDYEITLFGSTKHNELMSYLGRETAITDGELITLETYIDTGWNFVVIEFVFSEKRPAKSFYLPMINLRYSSDVLKLPRHFPGSRTGQSTDLSIYIFDTLQVTADGYPIEPLEFNRRIKGNSVPSETLEKIIDRKLNKDPGTLQVLYSNSHHLAHWTSNNMYFALAIGKDYPTYHPDMIETLMQQPFRRDEEIALTRIEGRILNTEPIGGIQLIHDEPSRRVRLPDLYYEPPIHCIGLSFEPGYYSYSGDLDNFGMEFQINNSFFLDDFGVTSINWDLNYSLLFGDSLYNYILGSDVLMNLLFISFGPSYGYVNGASGPEHQIGFRIRIFTPPSIFINFILERNSMVDFSLDLVSTAIRWTPGRSRPLVSIGFLRFKIVYYTRPFDYL